MTKNDEMNGCGNRTKLIWNRKRMGLDHKQFADKVGVNVITIRKLESDESAWDTLPDSILDKIMSLYASMASWQPERPDRVLQDINDVDEVVEEPQNLIEEEPLVTKTFGKCERLKQARKSMGLSQKQFADKVGLAQPTISKLERDETAWATLQDSTVDKIMSFYSNKASLKQEMDDKIIREFNEEKKESDKPNRCKMLTETIQKLGMSRAEFSVRVGINEKSIRRLEREEAAWDSVRQSTVDKLMDLFANAQTYEFKQIDKIHVAQQTRDELIVKQEPLLEEEITMAPLANINKESEIDVTLSNQDIKTLTLVEFAYEELTQAKTHDEFVDAIQMLRKIMNRY